MNCKTVKNLLSAYIENELEPSMKDMVKEHLLKCKNCNNELSFLRKYKKEMGSLESVKPPDDFLESVHRHLGRPSPLKQIIEKLFMPMRIKLPLEAAGVLATIVIAILLFKPSEQVRDTMYIAEREMKEEHIAIRKTTEAASERLAGKGKSPLTLDDKQEIIAKAGVKRVLKTPGESKTYEIALLIRQGPARDVLGLSEKDSIADIASAKKLKSSKLDEDQELEEKKDRIKTRSPSAQEKRYSQTTQMTESLVKIRRIAGSLEGKIISEEYNKKTNLPEYITLEIPTRNYKAFTDQLNQIGSVQKRRALLPQKRKAAAKLKIQLIQSK